MVGRAIVWSIFEMIDQRHVCISWSKQSSKIWWDIGRICVQRHESINHVRSLRFISKTSRSLKEVIFKDLRIWSDICAIWYQLHFCISIVWNTCLLFNHSFMSSMSSGTTLTYAVKKNNGMSSYPSIFFSRRIKILLIWSDRVSEADQVLMSKLTDWRLSILNYQGMATRWSANNCPLIGLVPLPLYPAYAESTVKCHEPIREDDSVATSKSSGL
jgi:hypothetical protein